MYPSKSATFLNYPSFVKRQLEYFDNVKFKTNEYDKMKSEYNNRIAYITANVIGLDKGQKLYRARPIKKQGMLSLIGINEKDFFSNIRELGINTKERTTAFGRANRPGEPVLYTGFRPETAIREMVQWVRTGGAMLERVISRHNDLRDRLIKAGADLGNPFVGHEDEAQSIHDADTFKNIVVSTWEVQEPLNMAYIFDRNLIPDEIKEAIAIQDSRTPKLKSNPSMDESTQLIADFFSKHFTKIKIEDESDYMISAMGAEFAQRTRTGTDGILYPIDGLIYASVAEGHQGTNCVLNQKAVEAGKIKFVSAECHSLMKPEDVFPGDKLGKEQIHMILAKAELASDGTGDLTWQIAREEAKQL